MTLERDIRVILDKEVLQGIISETCAERIFASIMAALNQAIPEATPISELPVAIPETLMPWISMVINAIASPNDLRTIELWGRYVGVSASSIYQRCCIVGVRPLNARNLVRVLRVVVRIQHGEIADPSSFFKVTDPRALAKLMRLGDPGAADNSFPRSVDEFLNRQRWVTRPDLITILRIQIPLSLSVPVA